jgi:hypothetical protein
MQEDRGRPSSVLEVYHKETTPQNRRSLLLPQKKNYEDDEALYYSSDNTSRKKKYKNHKMMIEEDGSVVLQAMRYNIYEVLLFCREGLDLRKKANLILLKYLGTNYDQKPKSDF